MRSCRLFRDHESAPWQAELTFSDGGAPTTIDCRTTDRGAAERYAAKVQRQREATRRWRARAAAAAKGQAIPVGAEVKAAVRPLASGKPRRGRPPRPSTPALDHRAIADRLRAMGGGGDPEPLGPEDPTPAPPAPPAEPTPATDAPPLPPPPPPGAEPLQPDAIIDGAAKAAADEEKDLFASMLATACVAGYIRGLRYMAENATPPITPNAAHPGSVNWVETGLGNKIRKLMGDRVVGDGTKILVGALGIAVSMFWGAEVASPKADAAEPQPTQEAEGGEGRPASATTPPPRPAPAPAPPRALNGIHTAGRGGTPPPEASASGRF